MRLWHPETGKSEKTWKFGSSVETCCCSPDGKYIACGVLDGVIFVFEMRSRSQLAVWQAHSECGQGPLLQFFADSTYLLSAAGATCKIWCARTSKLINMWDTTSITSLNIASNCTMLAVGSNNGVVTIHSLPDGNATRRVHAHRGEIWGIAFAPDNVSLATASRDDPESVKVWATDSWELVQVLRGHVGSVFDVGFSSDGLHLVTCGLDKTLRVWICLGSTSNTPNSWRCDNILVGHNDAVMSCAFSPSHSGNDLVASGARDGSARVWRLADVPKFTAADAAAYGLPLS